MRISPDQILTFAAVAELKSVTAAAKRLHLSQPAVSGQLKLLSDAIGEPLYRRIGHGIELTPAGEGLLFHAHTLRRLLQQVEEYRNRLRNIESGVLRIGASSTIASYVLPYRLADFREKYPGIEVHISAGNTEKILSCLPALDVAFVEGPAAIAQANSFMQSVWCMDEVVLVVRVDHELAQMGGVVSLSDAAQWPLISREPGSGTRQVFEHALARAGLRARLVLEVAGVEAVKEAVRAGLGVGYASSLALRYDSGQLAGLRINPPGGLVRPLVIISAMPDVVPRSAQAFMNLFPPQPGPFVAIPPPT